MRLYRYRGIRTNHRADPTTDTTGRILHVRVEIASQGNVFGHGQYLHRAGFHTEFTPFAVILIYGYAGHLVYPQLSICPGIALVFPGFDQRAIHGENRNIKGCRLYGIEDGAKPAQEQNREFGLETDLPGEIETGQHDVTGGFGQQMSIGNDAGKAKPAGNFYFIDHAQRTLERRSKRPPGVVNQEQIVVAEGEGIGEGTEHLGADIIAANIKDEFPGAPFDCTFDFRHDDRKVGMDLIAGGEEAVNAEGFKFGSCFAGAEIGINYIKIGDSDRIGLVGNEETGEIDGNFGLARTIPTYDYRDSFGDLG